MTLEAEIRDARQEIVSDGYEMSVGEVINLYRDKEIVISPPFQRLFRWDSSRKTRFIESLLLGIPIPPIFVFMRDDGIWELIDGLQRLSTILEFTGQLTDADGNAVAPSELDGTEYLPSLAGKHWEPTGLDQENGIGTPQQIQIKRSRLRVEILKQESDPKAKYELFQRLNTGGMGLSEQEVRNCVAVMLDPAFYEWLVSLAEYPAFRNTISQTDYALHQKMDVELALRFISFRNVEYQPGLDVHEYLDDSLYTIATNDGFDRNGEKDIFLRTFSLLDEELGSHAFKRWDGTTFSGKFLMSLFEVVAVGAAANLTDIEALPVGDRKEFLETKCQQLWENDHFQRHSGAGVRGTTRLANLLDLGKEFFAV